jgi:hypothetical protein
VTHIIAIKGVKVELRMDDPGVDLSNEADVTSMAFAAAEAAAAAEENEQQELAAAAARAAAAAEADQDSDSDHESEQDPYSVDTHYLEDRLLKAHKASAPAPSDSRTNTSNANRSTNNTANLKCRICGKCKEDDDRPMCHFLPAPVDEHTQAVAPGVVTFDQEIVLHVFCGKTASILPSINQPDLEILSKAGIKNKHGIGPEVNGALARTRSCTATGEGSKEKTFFIVKEFEAHLAAIRSASIGAASERFAVEQPRYAYYVNPQIEAAYHASLPMHAHYQNAMMDHGLDMYQAVAAAAAVPIKTTKGAPHKAGHTYQKRDPWEIPQDALEGKIRCGCGGTHLPTGTSRGDASWRSHVLTKRHQKWMEENGLLGQV